MLLRWRWGITSLFAFLEVRSPCSPGAAVGPASRRSRGRQLAFAMSPRRSPSPVLRFPGNQGWITSEVPWQGTSPPVLRRCVGPAVQGTHIPLPAGGSTGRTRHIAAAEFGGLASAVAVPELFLAQQGDVAPHRIRADRVQNQIETVIHCSPLKGSKVLCPKHFRPRRTLRNRLFHRKSGRNGVECQRVNYAHPNAIL